jgi:hypothetical protein
MKISLDFHLRPYLTLLLFITGLCSCTVFKHFPVSYYDLNKLNKKNLKLYLVDNEHVLRKVWSMQDMKTDQNKITCSLMQLKAYEAEEVVTISDQYDAVESQNNILFFAKPNLVENIINKETITFDYDALEKVVVVKRDDKATLIKSLKNTSLFFVITATVILPSIYLIDYFSGN